jgi:hypothetical protein
MWKNLVYSDDEYIYEGAVFRFPTSNTGNGYFEFIMEYLMRRTLDDKTPLEFIEYSGSHIGHKIVSLSKNLIQNQDINSSRECVQRVWLVENWYGHIYPYCNVEDVYYKTNTLCPRKLPQLKKYAKYEI